MSDVLTRLKLARQEYPYQSYQPHELLGEAIDELTAARDEAERLRARVAELEDLGSQVIRHIDSDMVTDSECESCQRAFHGLNRAIGSIQSSPAWLLRKQAEAVEASHSHIMTTTYVKDNASALDEVRRVLDKFEDYANNLRQQADDLDNV